MPRDSECQLAPKVLLIRRVLAERESQRDVVGVGQSDLPLLEVDEDLGARVRHRAHGVRQLLVRGRVVPRVGRGVVKCVVADVVQRARSGLLERAADRFQALPRLRRDPRDQLPDLLVGWL
jgi:hypothetical protein